MFEMNAAQTDAFSNATNGMTADSFCHVIIFLIGALATFWLFMVFVGTIKSNKKSIYESLYEFSFAVCIFTILGVVIYYT